MAEVLTQALVTRYETEMSRVLEASQNLEKFDVQLWTSMATIYRQKLWRARFAYQEEWVQFLCEQGIYGLSRTSIMAKMGIINGLVLGGASLEKAAQMTATRPGAAERLSNPQSLAAASKDQSVDEYLEELISLPSSGEAVSRVNTDMGNTVAMWLSDVTIAPAKDFILARLNRTDNDGFGSFDVVIRIMPNPQNKRPVSAVVGWLASYLKRARPSRSPKHERPN